MLRSGQGKNRTRSTSNRQWGLFRRIPGAERSGSRMAVTISQSYNPGPTVLAAVAAELAAERRRAEQARQARLGNPPTPVQ